MSEDGCKSCQNPIYSIGTFFACANAGCQRYATPVDAEGRTTEEAHQDAIKPLVADEGAESADEMVAQGDGAYGAFFEECMKAAGVMHDGTTARND